jgi:hypothetical protein
MTHDKKTNSSTKLPRILPNRVRSGELKLAKYILTSFGLSEDTVGDVVIDEQIALIQPHGDDELYLCPLVPNPQPPLSVVWFYADCLAFDHDIPVIVHPTSADVGRFGFRYLYNGTQKTRDISYENLDTGSQGTIHRRPLSPEQIIKTLYVEQLNNILGEIHGLHHGVLTCVEFRYSGQGGRVNIPYTRSYIHVSQEIHLYSSALRQADTLAEYLSYYRIIESASGSNGKPWITSAISRFRQHKFDAISISMIDETESRDLMGIYRRRALHRLNTLLTTYGSPEKVSSYLYNVLRCGIAHGRNIIRSDITPSYFEMVRDTYLIKLLARMAIDEKLGKYRL